MMHFKPVEATTDFTLRVAVSIAGGSGCGKTYSAMLLAQGLSKSGKIAIIDTENGRALHYQREFPDIKHFDFGPEIDGDMVGFPPERWIAQLKYLEEEGFDAVVIDSFSHAWEGIGGVLEAQAQELERLTSEAEARAQGNYVVNPDKFNQLSWVSIKKRYRRLIEAIIQAKMHVIVCIRAKPVMQKFDKKTRSTKNARDTKLRRDDLPWDTASDRDLMFEMTASMLMEPEAPGQPILLKCPDHFRGLFGGQARVSAEIGEAMADWAANGGQSSDDKALLDEARLMAREGTAAYTKWFKALPVPKRRLTRTISAELKRTAEAADNADSDDPFGATDDDAKPSEEELAQAEAAAKEAASEDIKEGEARAALG